MRVHVITNIREGKGLATDCRIVTALLEARGHYVVPCQFDAGPPGSQADLNLFLEVVDPRFFKSARVQWLIPNPEWWLSPYDRHIDRFDKVLCKTEDGARVFSRITGKAEYVGFESEDHFDPTVPRRFAFLHNPGGSTTKGTEAVLTAWRTYAIQHPLTVVSTVFKAHDLGPRTDVGWYERLADAEFRRVQNEHAVHLCPSEYEGWGHSLHEAMGVGATVVTTGAPPMDVIPAAVHVPTCSRRPQYLGTAHGVDPAAIYAAVKFLETQRERHGVGVNLDARSWFLADRAAFRQRFSAALAAL